MPVQVRPRAPPINTAMLITVHNQKLYKVQYDSVIQLRRNVESKLENLFKAKNQDNLIANGICSFWSEQGRLLHLWPEFREFMQFAQNHLHVYANSIGIDPQRLQIHSMWANKYPPNAFIKPHRHNRFGNESITCNFYLVKPDGSGNIVLRIPYTDCNGTAQIENYELETKVGEMIIFPSTVLHWTTPNTSWHDKITVGFDVYHGDRPDIDKFYQ